MIKMVAMFMWGHLQRSSYQTEHLLENYNNVRLKLWGK